MRLFELPERTKVGRVIPKNAFDVFINTKQKQLFTDLIKRITWTHKLSTETTNLPFNEVQEIQLFKIELKHRVEIDKVIELIQKHIPYHIVCWVEFDKEGYLSTSAKHEHPTKQNTGVIDWTFRSEWLRSEEAAYSFSLKVSLDIVFKHICEQLSTVNPTEDQPLDKIVDHQRELDRLLKEKAKIESAIRREKQFNKRVELNQKLKKVQFDIEALN